MYFVIVIYLYLEIAFFMFEQTRRHALAKRVNAPYISQVEKINLWKKCASNVSSLSEWTSGWMYNIKPSEVTEKHHLKFAAWALFDVDLNESLDETSYPLIIECCKSIGAVKKDSSQINMHCRGNVRSFNIEPLYVIHKPLVFMCIYYVIFVVGQMYALNIRGFQFEISEGIGLWHRKGNGNSPIFFWHGLGFGLIPYLRIIDGLTKSQRPIIIYDLNFLTPKVTFETKHKLCILSSINGLKKYGYLSGTHVGHSFGTVIMRWIYTNRTDLVLNMVFISPVVFLYHYSDVTKNFIYQGQKWNASIIDRLIACDLNIQATLKRHTWWYENIMWAEDIIHPALVILSIHDQIVPTSEVKDYLLQNRFVEAPLECYDNNAINLSRLVIQIQGLHGESLFGRVDSENPEKITKTILDWLKNWGI